jgi:hypothetical protein
MKTCTYCGKEHPDDASVCSIDGQPLRLIATTPPDGEQPHSMLGIASFSISMAVGSLMLAAFLLAGILNAGRVQRSQRYPGQEILGFVILLLLAADLGAVGLGIATLCESGKKRLFGLLGLVFSSGTLIGSIGLMVLGLIITGRFRH